MRTARGTTGVSREDLAGRLHRDRAAAQVLRAVFPEVRLLRLEMEFGGTPSPPAGQVHALHPPARAFFRFLCPYADCSGQFDLAEAVQAAVSDPSHRVEGLLECSGARNRDHASKQPCQLRLSYTITATCEEES